MMATMMEWIVDERLLALVRIAAYLLGGVPLVLIGSRMGYRIAARNGSELLAQLIRRVLAYAGVFLLGLLTLSELGFDLTGLLAAAGIVTVALGFAAQTSLANVFSGMFVVFEKSLKTGDVIRIQDIEGVVVSVGLLSTQVRTQDNIGVRVPNEHLMKYPVMNLSRYPIRRTDFRFRVPAETDLAELRKVLHAVAESSGECLIEPEPAILVEDMGDYGFQVLFGVWFERSRYTETRNEVFANLDRHLKAAGIRHVEASSEE